MLHFVVLAPEYTKERLLGRFRERPQDARDVRESVTLYFGVLASQEGPGSVPETPGKSGKVSHFGVLAPEYTSAPGESCPAKHGCVQQFPVCFLPSGTFAWAQHFVCCLAISEDVCI